MATGNLPPITYVTSSPVILAFPTLFVPRKYKDEQGNEGKEANYSVRALMRPDFIDIPAIRSKLFEAAARAWPAAQFSDPNAPNYMAVQWALRSGDTLADRAKLKNKDHEHLRGWTVLDCATGEKYPPKLGAVVNGELRNVPLDPVERQAWTQYFYGGVEAFVTVNLKGYLVGSNQPGVKAYLSIVSSMSRGERNPKFEGGGVTATQAHGESVKGHISSVDPRGSNVVPIGGMPAGMG